MSETIQSRRADFSTGRSTQRSPSFASTPITWSAAGAITFMTCAVQPRPRSSVRARMRSPRPSAPRLPFFSTTRSLGGGASASHRSGTATGWSPSTSTTRSTVTLGTPPMAWKARPGDPSISPSSAMSRSSAFSWIFAAPDSPNARAISRFPAGVSEAAMKSRICCREGRSGAVMGCEVAEGGKRG